jgi:hypothetical protein
MNYRGFFNGFFGFSKDYEKNRRLFMDKRRIEALEKAIRQKTGKSEYPPPAFFKAGDSRINTYHEDLLRQGFTLEQVNKTPIFIEG